MTTPAGDDAAKLPCPNCGYDLRGGFEREGQTSAECPECGARWLLVQLTGELRPQEQPRPLGVIGFAASLAPAVIAVIGLFGFFLSRQSDRWGILLLAMSFLTPPWLAAIGAWRYHRFHSRRRRWLRIAGFTVLFLIANCAMFGLLSLATVITLGLIAPELFNVD